MFLPTENLLENPRICIVGHNIGTSRVFHGDDWNRQITRENALLHGDRITAWF